MVCLHSIKFINTTIKLRQYTHVQLSWIFLISLYTLNCMECKQTMYVRGLRRLKHGLLWVPINTFLFAQMSPNLARSFVRCYLSNREILMSVRQELRKMLFFIFIFQIEERVLYFFPSQIRYGVFDVYTLKKKSWKNIKY